MTPLYPDPVTRPGPQISSIEIQQQKRTETKRCETKIQKHTDATTTQNKTSLRLIRRIEKLNLKKTQRIHNEATTNSQRDHIETTSNSLRNSVNSQRNHNDITTGTHRNHLEFSVDTREFGAIFFVISHPLRRISKPHRIHCETPLIRSDLFGRFHLGIQAERPGPLRGSTRTRCAGSGCPERCAGSASPFLFVKGKIWQ